MLNHEEIIPFAFTWVIFPFCFCTLHLLMLPLSHQSRKTLLPLLSVSGWLVWYCLNCSVSYLVGMAWICSSMQWQTSRCSRPSRILNTINEGLRSKLNMINIDIFIIHGMQLCQLVTKYFQRIIPITQRTMFIGGYQFSMQSFDETNLNKQY